MNVSRAHNRWILSAGILLLLGFLVFGCLTQQANNSPNLPNLTDKPPSNSLNEVSFYNSYCQKNNYTLLKVGDTLQLREGDILRFLGVKEYRPDNWSMIEPSGEFELIDRNGNHVKTVYAWGGGGTGATDLSDFQYTSYPTYPYFFDIDVCLADSTYNVAYAKLSKTTPSAFSGVMENWSACPLNEQMRRGEPVAIGGGYSLFFDYFDSYVSNDGITGSNNGGYFNVSFENSTVGRLFIPVQHRFLFSNLATGQNISVSMCGWADGAQWAYASVRSESEGVQKLLTELNDSKSIAILNGSVQPTQDCFFSTEQSKIFDNHGSVYDGNWTFTLLNQYDNFSIGNWTLHLVRTNNAGASTGHSVGAAFELYYNGQYVPGVLGIKSPSQYDFIEPSTGRHYEMQVCRASSGLTISTGWAILGVKSN